MLQPPTPATHSPTQHMYPHLNHILGKQRVDALQVCHCEGRQLAAAVLSKLHGSATDVVGLAEGHACSVGSGQRRQPSKVPAS